MRMELTPGDTPNTWKVSGAQMSMGGAAPKDMPVPANTPPIKKGEGVGKVVGHSAVKTAVGTFESKQYESSIPQGTINIWMSDKVPPVGLVKQELADGQLTTILTAQGTGATSKMPPPGAKPAEEAKPTAKPAAKPADKPAKK
jgi:hypothetical protein